MQYDKPIHGRLPEESTAAYEAFRVYRDDGPGKRSLKRTAVSLGKNKGMISGWSSKHQWVERVRAFDDKSENEIQTIENAIKKASAERHLTQAQRLQEIGMDEIERLAEFSKSSPIPLIRPEVAARMVADGFKMERLVEGQTTEHSAHIVSVKPLTPAEIEHYNSIITTKIKDDTDVDY